MTQLHPALRAPTVSPAVSQWVEDASVERILLTTDVAIVGALNSPPTSSYFRGEHRTTNYLIGFPRSPLWIRQNRGKSFVADASVATVYNRGQVFTRAKIGPRGDVSEWFGVAEDVVRDIVRTFDERAAESEQPLKFTRARISSDLYRRQRLLAARVAATDLQCGELEEEVVWLFSDVVSSAFASSAAEQSDGRYELVERAREVLAATFTQNLGVREIARRCDASVFHLCRVFRAATGTTLVGYRRELRLRAAASSIADHRGDLSRMALELGFVSHSHFTSAFRREFGLSPTAYIAGQRAG